METKIKNLYTWKNNESELNKDNCKENPLDLLDNQDMFNRDCKENDFYTVEKVDKKFKLGAKINVCNLFNAGVEYLVEKTTLKPTKQNNTNKDYAQIGSSGNSAKIGSSGDSAQIGSSGYYAQIGSSGYYAQIGSSGNYAQIGSSGNYAQIGSSGNYAQIGSSGDSAQIGSSGYYAKIGSSGDYAKIGSSGDYAKIGSSGNSAKIGSSGDYAKIGSSGDYAQIEITGKDSIGFACGYESRIKSANGTWISLAEYELDKKLYRYVPCFAKSAQIDNADYLDCFGKKLNDKYYYELINKEFVPELIIDGSVMVIKSQKTLGDYTIYKTQYVSEYKDGKKTTQIVANRGEICAHGNDIKSAIADVEFKYLQSQDMQSHIERIKKQGYMTATDYRLITGACQYGTNKWLEENGFTWEDKKTVEEVAELVKGEYGSERFAEFVKLFKEKK